MKMGNMTEFVPLKECLFTLNECGVFVIIHCYYVYIL